MGWLRRRDEHPSLEEVWRTLAPRYEATVDVRGPESVHVTGTVGGRALEVEIESRRRPLEELHRIGVGPRAQKVYRWWTSRLEVSCANPHALDGALTSFQDVRDPAWDPHGFDPAHCRKVVSEPPGLAQWVLTPSIHDALLRPWDDVTFVVGPGSVRLAGEKQAKADIGYFGGCPFHMHPDGGAIDDRFLAGPPWWIDLLCEIADAVDAGAAPR